ncbi:MAG: PKD domain-containing protein [Bacteroidetes bacterium]|nr:PKD domain-containing protein [Bacteroidota bacterium]
MKYRFYLLYWLLIFFYPLKAFSQNAPLEFIENQGQWSGNFQYKSSSLNSDIYLAKNSVRYVIGASNNRDLLDAFRHGSIKEQPLLKFHAYQMTLEGATTQEIAGSKKQIYYYNYFLGNDPNKWKTGIYPFLALDYSAVYPYVDMHLSSEKGNLKYDFIVKPKGNAEQIRLRFDGLDAMALKQQNLILKTSVGDVTELKPYAYQVINGEKQEIKCRYSLQGNVLSFRFPEGYNENETLVIDPTIVFCTFTGSTADNWGFTATYDNQGNFYAGGLVSGMGYPVSLGAFQTTYGGGQQSGTFTDSTHGSDYACDIGIMKLDATGANKIYATYIGGSDNEQPHSLIVDANNNLIIAGRTYSNNYPVSAGAFDNSYNGGGDIILTKLNATGTALLASTFLGGTKEDGVNFNSLETVFGGLKHNYGDDARSEVMVDNAGNIYLTSCTKSTNFPITSTAFQSSFQGLQDAVVIKMNPNLSAMIYGTYLGGSGQDAGYVLELDHGENNFYVAGGTGSSDFPSTSGTIWGSYQGGSADGFIVKFQNSFPYTLSKATFVGRNDYDQVYGLQLDVQNNVYVMGQTLGGTFPVSAGVYNNPNSSQFILKTDANLSTILLSTVYGSGISNKTNISPVAFLVDTCNNIYISGWGGGLGFSPSNVGTTVNMPLSVAPATPAQSITDGNDFYFIVLSSGMQSLLYATYYGRISSDPGKGEHVDGGTSRFDKNGVVYQAICGGCAGNGLSAPPFPTTPGSLSPTNGSSNCNEVALKIAFQLTALKANAITIKDTVGCAPFKVKFTNNSVNAVTYKWYFGDGSQPDTTFSPSHTFNIPGTYTVKLVVTNPGACYKTMDSTFVTIMVDSSSIHSNFTYNILNSCNPYLVSFNNTSVFSAKPGAQSRTKFTWYFDDGTTFAGANPPNHNFPDTGTYTVMLVMVDTASCNNPDTMRKTFKLSSDFVKAHFIPDSVCVGTSILFSNQSSNALSYVWNFGNGNTSNAASPTFTYTTPGTYTVTLVALNSGTCNKSDSSTKKVVIWPLPKADFNYTPLIPVANEAIKFTNTSKDADTYFWGFGDGSSSTLANPSHLYNKTGRYKVCLEAKNKFGCVNQTCKYVDAEIYPAIDVPTAFSPNGDGVNDVLYVRGAAVDKLLFRVYNRWGEKVFETNDINVGWDGNYKGKPQEVEVYAWVLEATFLDGTTESRSGNVTLLR